MSIDISPGTRRRGAATAVRQRLTEAEDHLRQIEQELQVTSPEAALAAIRHLKERALPLSSPAVGAEIAGMPTALADPRVALARVREFATKVAALNGTVASMEDQLKSLYADRERLEREIGASEADDVVAAFQGLKDTIRSMETQLTTLYAGRELLDVELGKSDPKEIVAMFRNVRQLINTARRELE